MDLSKDVSYKFDLSGMKPRDQFLGCECGFHFQPGQATKPECPECGKRLYIYVVTDNDLLKYKGTPVSFTYFDDSLME